jgi:hypothetical protein
LVVGDDHDATVLPDTDAGVGRPQVDPDGRAIVPVGHLTTFFRHATDRGLRKAKRRRRRRDERREKMLVRRGCRNFIIKFSKVPRCCSTVNVDCYRCMLHAGRLLRWKTNRRQCMNASTIDRCWRIDLDAAVSPPTLRACLDGGL